MSYFNIYRYLLYIYGSNSLDILVIQAICALDQLTISHRNRFQCG